MRFWIAFLAAVGLLSGSVAWAGVGSDDGGARGWQFSCGAGPFSLDVFDAPPNAEDGDHPSDAALRRELARSDRLSQGRKLGWHLLYRDQSVAEYGRGTPERRVQVVEVTTAYSGDGSWEYSNSGGCHPSPYADGLNGATWEARGRRARSSERKVRALVTETACASGRSAKGRIARPRISYGQKRIVIAAFVRPQKRDVQTCPGNPAARHIFRLREPIGDRTVVDGSSFPFERRLNPPR